jgi:DNA-binding MarR family transcriptional regulator
MFRCVQADAVDRLIDQWRAVRPDLAEALPAMATIGRIGRLHQLARAQIEAVLGGHGLSIGEFDVLAALRRSGEPYALRPIDLARTLMLSPAGMTSRLDVLEQPGWIGRRHDRIDRRSIIVELTPAGLELVDTAVTAHVANEERILSALSAKQRTNLDAILRQLLASLE